MQHKTTWNGEDRRISERRTFGRELTTAEREHMEARLKDRRYVADRRRAEIQRAHQQ